MGNETQARSRFWYFIRRLVKMKKANAEILSLREIFEKKPDKVSKYGIWLRYDSRTFLLHPHHQVCRDRGEELRSRQHQAVPQGQHRLPADPPCAPRQQEGIQQGHQGPAALHLQAVDQSSKLVLPSLPKIGNKGTVAEQKKNKK